MLDFGVINISIGRSYSDAYRFLSDGRSLNAWGGTDPGTDAIALGDRDWLVQIDGIGVMLRYSRPNPHGILDMRAYRQGGEPGPVTPVRLYPNVEGCELDVVVFREQDRSDEQFASDVEWLRSDLLRLKTFLEKGHPPGIMRRTHVTALAIGRPLTEVARFFREPRNLGKWMSLRGHYPVPVGGPDWRVETMAGPRIVRLPEANEHGILDYAVFVEGGEPLLTPMRAVDNGGGTLLTHTLFDSDGRGGEAFEWAIDSVTTDLMTARSLLES